MQGVLCKHKINEIPLKVHVGSSRRPGELSSSHDVKVKVVDRLTAMTSIVDHWGREGLTNTSNY